MFSQEDLADSWLFSSRRQALTLLAYYTAIIALPKATLIKSTKPGPQALSAA